MGNFTLPEINSEFVHRGPDIRFDNGYQDMRIRDGARGTVAEVYAGSIWNPDGIQRGNWVRIAIKEPELWVEPEYVGKYRIEVRASSRRAIFLWIPVVVLYPQSFPPPDGDVIGLLSVKPR